MKKMWILFAFICTSNLFLNADMPLPPPEDITVYSANRKYIGISYAEKNKTVCYQINKNKRKEIWSIEGWNRSFYISDDGNYLVIGYSGLNLLSEDYKPEWTAISIYYKGKLIKDFQFKELIIDFSKLQKTASHYYWGSIIGLYGNIFKIETVEAILSINIENIQIIRE
jgi:hypothetical protein